MKKATIYIVAFFVLTTYFNSFAQLAKSSWSFGFGFKYPRFLSSGLTPNERNFGTFACLERDFNEHVGFRLNSNYLHMEGNYSGVTQKTNMLALNYELLYKFVPCEKVSPFAIAGLGNILYKFAETFPNQPESKFYLDYQINFGLGVEWRISDDWNLIGEMDYHTAANNSLDGINNNVGNGLLGGISDTYMGLKLGFQYYFSKGEPSRLCDVYNGLSAQPEIDYDRIESIIRKYQSKPLETIDYDKIEEIVKKYQPSAVSPAAAAAAPAENWILVGVNFDPNEAKFKTESYPILYHAAQVLLMNQELKVEVQGYTDNTGPDMFNLNLSLQRANAVKDYLVAHGVSADRVSAVGLGSKNPVADNKTAAGRILNRRIEFKILNK